jgi:hypothetical protein
VLITNNRELFATTNDTLFKKINRRISVITKCYRPQVSESSDPIIFFVDPIRNQDQKRQFLTTVVDGYEGVNLEDSIANFCRNCCDGQETSH